MADLPIPISTVSGGVNRDYVTIFEDLKKLIPHFTPEWTYTGEDDLGITLVQLLSYLADHLNYRSDTVLRDLRAATTIDRDILVRLSEWLGYFPRRATAASASVTFNLPQALGTDFFIPEGTQVSASASNLPENNATDIIFELNGQVRLVAGTNTVVGTVVEGETKTISLGQATGEAFETFTLTDAAAIFNQADNDLDVRVNGTAAKLFKYPVMAGPSDLAYAVRETKTGELDIKFGDGRYGKRLAVGDNVTCLYRSGGGRRGLVSAGAIDTMVTALSRGGVNLQFSVINLERSFGGSSEEDMEDIRQAAPAHFRTQNRAVTLEDYEIHALSVPGVFKARPVRMGVNGILFYIVPDNVTDSFVFSDAFRSQFLRALDSVRMATDVVEIAESDLVPIDVSLQCFAFPSQRNVTIRRRVREEFTRAGGILDFNSNELGQHLRRSDMVAVVEAVDGLDYVDVLKYSRRPYLKWAINSGGAELDLVNPDDRPAITDRTIEEDWTVTFTDATNFSVVGSVTGEQIGRNQGGLGTIGIAYTAKNVSGEAMLTFKLKAGSQPMQAGDRGVIRVGTLDSNIQLAPGEFPVGGEISIFISGGIE